MQWPFLRKQEDTGKVEYEEISEKKTSVLGYVLLIFMFISLVWAGEVAFHDLSNLISIPKYPSACFSQGAKDLERVSVNIEQPRRSSNSYDDSYFGSNEDSYSDSYYNTYYNSYDDYGTCSLGGFTEKQGASKALLQENLSQLVELQSLQNEIQGLKASINSLQGSMEKSRKEYDTGLLENIAGQNGVIDDVSLQNSLSLNQNQIRDYQVKLSSLKSQEVSLRSQLTPMATQMEKLYTQAMDQYKTDKAWYTFKVAGIQFLFIVPLFFFALSRYFSLKRKDSPYTIIATAALGALGFLFLQVAGLFIWEIIPRGLLEKIFMFFREIAILRYVLYYAFIGLVIAVFGGMVYIIQKRVFNSRAVAVRRIKDKKCPGCSFPLDVHLDTFCGKCGLQILEVCGSCQKAKVKYLDHCSHCGGLGRSGNIQG